jgi:hypothetical protein
MTIVDHGGGSDLGCGRSRIPRPSLAEVGRSPLVIVPKQRAIPFTPPIRAEILQGGTSMTLTTAKQLARQAEEARRAARQHDYSVQSLRKQHLVD